MTSVKTVLLILITMIAFAANSILCRLALRETSIDAITFTTVRIVSGAIVLWFLAGGKTAYSNLKNSSWLSGTALLVYAVAFSVSYLTVSAGTGALLLFTAVQATMIVNGIRSGEKLGSIKLLGMTLAAIGFVILIAPGVSAPPVVGAILMIIAGIAWGIYSIRGKAATKPIDMTMVNFIRAAAIIIPVYLLSFQWTQFDMRGLIYAGLSGAIASGIGYSVWYYVLPHIRSTTAATVQLSVPILVAIGGILFLSEFPSIRLFLCSVLVLGGIALVLNEEKIGK